MEMKSAHFHIITEAPPKKVEGQWGKWQKGAGEKNIRLSHHTAVVVGVERDTVRVVEQNGSVPGAVGVEKYDLGEMKRGEVGFFRVVGEKWVGALVADWEGGDA